jgi:hypothetical protein
LFLGEKRGKTIDAPLVQLEKVKEQLESASNTMRKILATVETDEQTIKARNLHLLNLGNRTAPRGETLHYFKSYH